MVTPVEKGNALEAAVASIENLILSASPNLRERPFLIESKKIINVGGVRHEIDIFVTIDLGDGYNSIFVFECKNWEEAVNKNEIIVFSEKIEASRAQYGYFVAKSFTKDAQAQAAKDHRVSLLLAKENDPTTAPLPYGFHGIFLTPEHADATFFGRGGQRSKFDTVDFNTVSAKLRGKIINLREYLQKWAEEASSRDVLKFQSYRLPEGVYDRALEDRREYDPGEFTLDGRDIESGQTSVRYKVTVWRPAVLSYFEIESRGRVVTLAPVQLPTGVTMQINLASR